MWRRGCEPVKWRSQAVNLHGGPLRVYRNYCVAFCGHQLGGERQPWQRSGWALTLYFWAPRTISSDCYIPLGLAPASCFSVDINWIQSTVSNVPVRKAELPVNRGSLVHAKSIHLKPKFTTINAPFPLLDGEDVADKGSTSLYWTT